MLYHVSDSLVEQDPQRNFSRFSEMQLGRRSFLGTSAAAISAVASTGLAATPTSFPITKLPTATQIRRRHRDLWELVDLLNAYRRSVRLPSIALSPQLTAVAMLHAKDLVENRPHERYGSLHSWSRSANWTGGAYVASDKKTWPLMWDKPKELTRHQGYGFEICAADVRDAKHALTEWKASKSHNDVIVNRAVWAEPRWQWKSVGAVFYKGFACAWFGDQSDVSK